MKTPLNQRTVTVKITRSELISLMLACTSLSQGENRERWKELHAKLKVILDDFDEKNSEE